jgi:hypothetical protein
MEQAFSIYGTDKKCIQKLIRKPKGKTLHIILRHRQKDSIKTDVEETDCEGVEWIQLAQPGSSGGF